MKSRNLALMCAAIGMVAGITFDRNLMPMIRTEKEDGPTIYDRERLDRAKEKRERKRGKV